MSFDADASLNYANANINAHVNVTADVEPQLEPLDLWARGLLCIAAQRDEEVHVRHRQPPRHVHPPFEMLLYAAAAAF